MFSEETEALEVRKLDFERYIDTKDQWKAEGGVGGVVNSIEKEGVLGRRQRKGDFILSLCM